MINVVFAILMISNGNIIEYVPVDSLGACLEEKRKITRSIGENQEGIYMQCKEVEAETLQNDENSLNSDLKKQNDENKNVKIDSLNLESSKNYKKSNLDKNPPISEQNQSEIGNKINNDE